MKNETLNITEIQKKLQSFADERDWEQFHHPKNLAMALSVEVSELVEIFQWKKGEDKLSVNEQKHAEEEIADIMLYLIRLADKLDIEIYEALMNKIKINGHKYPPTMFKGSAKKYNG